MNALHGNRSVSLVHIFYLIFITTLLSACGSGIEKAKSDADDEPAGIFFGIVDLWGNDQQGSDQDNTVTALMSGAVSVDKLSGSHVTLSYNNVGSLEPYLCGDDTFENGLITLHDNSSASLDDDGDLNNFVLMFRDAYSFNYSYNENQARLTKWVHKTFGPQAEGGGYFYSNIDEIYSTSGDCGNFDGSGFYIDFDDDMYVLGREFVLPEGVLVDDLGRENPRMVIRFAIDDGDWQETLDDLPPALETSTGLEGTAYNVINKNAKDLKFSPGTPDKISIAFNSTPTVGGGFVISAEKRFTIFYPDPDGELNPNEDIFADEYLLVDIVPGALAATLQNTVEAINNHPTMSQSYTAAIDGNNGSAIELTAKFVGRIGLDWSNLSLTSDRTSGQTADRFQLQFNGGGEEYRLNSITANQLSAIFDNGTPFADKVKVVCQAYENYCDVELTAEVNLNDGVYELIIPANSLSSNGGFTNSEELKFRISDAITIPQLLKVHVNTIEKLDDNRLNAGDQLVFEFSESMNAALTRTAIFNSLKTIQGATLLDVEPLMVETDISSSDRFFTFTLGVGDELIIDESMPAEITLAALTGVMDVVDVSALGGDIIPRIAASDLDLRTGPSVEDAYVQISNGIKGDNTLVAGDRIYISFSEAMDDASVRTAIAAAFSGTFPNVTFSKDEGDALNEADIFSVGNPGQYYIQFRNNMKFEVTGDFSTDDLASFTDSEGNSILRDANGVEVAAGTRISIALSDFDNEPGTGVTLNRVFVNSDYNQCDLAAAHVNYNNPWINFYFNREVTTDSGRQAILDWWNRMVESGQAVDAIGGHTINNVDYDDGREFYLQLGPGASLQLNEDIQVSLDPALIVPSNPEFSSSTVEQLTATLVAERGFEINIYQNYEAVKGDGKLRSYDSINVEFSCDLDESVSAQVWDWFYNSVLPRSSGPVVMYEDNNGDEGEDYRIDSYEVQVLPGGEIDMSTPLSINLQNVITRYGQTVSASSTLNADLFNTNIRLDFSSIEGRNAVFTSATPIPSGTWYVKSSSLPILGNNLNAVFSQDVINTYDDYDEPFFGEKKRISVKASK
ncbi:MAG: hypothetical protein OEY38_20675 [Gammaproteobacteria bacterium]|nr:hypothetical protein [Gammaproteobacteria bacterium]